MERGPNEKPSAQPPTGTSSAQPGQPATPVSAQLLPCLPPSLALHQVPAAPPQTLLVVPNLSPAQWQTLIAAQMAQHTAALVAEQARTRTPLAPRMVQQKGPAGKASPAEEQTDSKTESTRHVHRMLVSMAMTQIMDDPATGKDWRTKFQSEKERNLEIAKVVEGQHRSLLRGVLHYQAL